MYMYSKKTYTQTSLQNKFWQMQRHILVLLCICHIRRFWMRGASEWVGVKQGWGGGVVAFISRSNKSQDRERIVVKKECIVWFFKRKKSEKRAH